MKPLGRRKDPFDRLRIRIPVCPVFEEYIRSDLFYDPWDILNAEGFVYLIRFSVPIDTRTDGKAPKYYIGSARLFTSFLQRLWIHNSRPDHSNAAKIIVAAKENGATLTLARFWHCYRAYDLERFLKGRGGNYSRYDPCSNPDYWQTNPMPKTIERFRNDSFYRWQSTPDPLDSLFGPA